MKYIIQNGYGEFIFVFASKREAKAKAKEILQAHKAMGESEYNGSPPFRVYECRIISVEC